jgi:1,4-alpha-glucan branching enzyme
MRKFSGVKYHRITRRGSEKELYDCEAAHKAADAHAAHFLDRRQWQVRELAQIDTDPIILAPFEGPQFLELLIRKAAAQHEISLTTPSEYLAAHPTQQTVTPTASTWGDKGHLEVWLNPTNAWIYPRLHAAERQMTEVARRFAELVGPAGGAPALQSADRVLKQLARELLLAQASDWAFLITNGTARDYATRRTLDHLDRFERLHDEFARDDVDLACLTESEERDNLFPNLNWRHFL